MNKVCLFSLGLLITSVFSIPIANAAVTWRCLAVDSGGATWHQYASTRTAAAKGALLKCRSQPIHPACSVRCYSSQPFWTCVAEDKAGKNWQWIAESKKQAKSNAIDACLHNSATGGCKVHSGACTSAPQSLKGPNE